MKTAITTCALVLALPFATAVNAQTCASPTPIASYTDIPDGTTCGGEIGINMNGTIYGHPSVVYSFTFQPDDESDGITPDQITLATADREMSVIQASPTCSNAPIAVGAPGLPISVEEPTFTAGQEYYIVVSTDPSLTVTDPPRCGAYAINTDSLPVELQSFTVE